MKILLRAALLFFLFLIALSILKYFVIKLVFLAIWIGGIAFLIYFLSRLIKKT